MTTPFRIGLGPHRESGVVCHNAKCGSRDAVTNVCRLKVSPNLCRDHVQQKNPAERTDGTHGTDRFVQ